MFTHIGNDVNVRTDRIIGLFDLDTSSVGKGTKIFLQKMQERGRVINTSADIPRCAILADDENRDGAVIYLSSVSSTTIATRRNSTCKTTTAQ